LVEEPAEIYSITTRVHRNAPRGGALALRGDQVPASVFCRSVVVPECWRALSRAS